MAKPILLCLGLFACCAMIPSIQCGGQGTHEDTVDIPGVQKKLKSEMAVLQKSTQKQIAKLEKAMENLDDEAYKLGLKVDRLNRNEKESAKLQERTENLLKRINMEVGPTELERKNIRKMMDKFKEACQAEIAKIGAEEKKLYESRKAHIAELEAKCLERMKPIYEEKIATTRKELQPLIEQYTQSPVGGNIEDLANGWIRAGAPNAELHNKIVALKSDLERYKEKSTKFSMNYKECKSEREEIRAAYQPYYEQSEQLGHARRTLHNHVDEMDSEKRKMNQIVEDAKKMATPKEVQQLELLKGERNKTHAQLSKFRWQEKLGDVLIQLVDCLSTPLTGKCKGYREQAKELAQTVAEKQSEASQSSAGRKSSGLVGIIGGLFASGDSDQKLANCEKEITSIYDKVVQEERQKLAANFAV